MASSSAPLREPDMPLLGGLGSPIEGFFFKTFFPLSPAVCCGPVLSVVHVGVRMMRVSSLRASVYHG